MLKPKNELPNISLKILKEGEWNPGTLKDAGFMNVLIFYRGLHCPICKKYLKELNTKIDDFKDMGVNVMAISTDGEVRARKTMQDWDIPKVKLAYDLSIEQAKELGLYISTSIKEEEPDQFSEPAMVLVRPDQSVYAVEVQSMPFTRPNLDELLKNLQFIKEKEYPARGAA